MDFILPQEFAGMFDVVPSTINYGGSGVLLIAKQDAARIGILVGATIPGFVQVAVGTASQAGLPVSGTQPALMITNKDFGALTAAPFFFTAGASGIVYLVEVFLRRPPPAGLGE